MQQSIKQIENTKHKTGNSTCLTPFMHHEEYLLFFERKVKLLPFSPSPVIISITTKSTTTDSSHDNNDNNFSNFFISNILNKNSNYVKIVIMCLIPSTTVISIVFLIITTVLVMFIIVITMIIAILAIVTSLIFLVFLIWIGS